MAYTATPAFHVVRILGEIQGGATSAFLTNVPTVTEPLAHYTLPAGVDASRCFVRIANTRLTGMGIISGGGNQNTRDWTVRIDNPENVATGLQISRATNINNTIGFTLEIICYVGPAGGPNEFVVRKAEKLATGEVSSATFDGATFTGYDDFNRLICLTTSQSGDQTSRNQAGAWLFTATLVDEEGGNAHATMIRSQSSALSAHVSYAAIELTGSNWATPYRQGFITEGSNWAPGDEVSFTAALTTPVGDATKTLAYHDHRFSNNNAGLDDAGDVVLLDDENNWRVLSRTNNGTTTRSQFVVENTQNHTAGAGVRNLRTQSLLYSRDYNDPVLISPWFIVLGTPIAIGSPYEQWPGGNAVDVDTETSLSCTCSMDGSGTAYPQGAIDYVLIGSFVFFEESVPLQERRIGVEVIEWPQDAIHVAEAAATSAPDVAQVNIAVPVGFISAATDVKDPAVNTDVAVTEVPGASTSIAAEPVQVDRAIAFGFQSLSTGFFFRTIKITITPPGPGGGQFSTPAISAAMTAVEMPPKVHQTTVVGATAVATGQPATPPAVTVATAVPVVGDAATSVQDGELVHQTSLVAEIPAAATGLAADPVDVGFDQTAEVFQVQNLFATTRPLPPFTLKPGIAPPALTAEAAATAAKDPAFVHQTVPVEEQAAATSVGIVTIADRPQTVIVTDVPAAATSLPEPVQVNQAVSPAAQSVTVAITAVTPLTDEQITPQAVATSIPMVTVIGGAGAYCAMSTAAMNRFRSQVSTPLGITTLQANEPTKPPELAPV